MSIFHCVIFLLYFPLIDSPIKRFRKEKIKLVLTCVQKPRILKITPNEERLTIEKVIALAYSRMKRVHISKIFRLLL